MAALDSINLRDTAVVENSIHGTKFHLCLKKTVRPVSTSLKT